MKCGSRLGKLRCELQTHWHNPKLMHQAHDRHGVVAWPDGAVSGDLRDIAWRAVGQLLTWFENLIWP